MADYETLDIDELEQEIQQADERRVALQEVLEQRLEQEKHDLAQELKELIVERGQDVLEIVSLVSTRQRRGGSRKPRAADTGSARQYTKYVDPDSSANTYVRGPLPRWLKQKMTDAGFDPAVKEDRDAFRANHLNTI